MEDAVTKEAPTSLSAPDEAGRHMITAARSPSSASMRESRLWSVYGALPNGSDRHRAESTGRLSLYSGGHRTVIAEAAQHP